MKEKSNCCNADIYHGDEHVLDGYYCSKCDKACSFNRNDWEKQQERNKEIFNSLQADMMRGTIQERLGYDLYDKILNNSFEGLPAASREKFEAFLKKEPNIVIINPHA